MHDARIQYTVNPLVYVKMREGPTTLFNALPCVVCVYFASDYFGTPPKNIEYIFGSKVQLPGLYKVFQMVAIG